MRLKFLTPPAPLLCLGMKMLGEAPVTFLAALTEVALCTHLCVMSWKSGKSENEGPHFLAVTSQDGASGTMLCLKRALILA